MSSPLPFLSPLKRSLTACALLFVLFANAFAQLAIPNADDQELLRQQAINQPDIQKEIV